MFISIFFQGSGVEGEMNKGYMESSGQLKGAGVEGTTSSQDEKDSSESVHCDKGAGKEPDETSPSQL